MTGKVSTGKKAAGWLRAGRRRPAAAVAALLTLTGLVTLAIAVPSAAAPARRAAPAAPAGRSAHAAHATHAAQAGHAGRSAHAVHAAHAGHAGRSAHAAAAARTRHAANARPAARTAPAGGAAPAGDRPPGFWYGTDSHQMAVTGTGPYTEPVIGGSYGGYIGMVGNWAKWQGCHGQLVWSKANAAQATANFGRYHKGTGLAGYWFMAGPGVDPSYNGTAAEASAWGRKQAARALADTTSSVNYPVIWMDVEIPGNAPDYTPAPDNGWNAVYTTPCSGVVKKQHIAAAVDRAVLDGFASYLTAHSKYLPGVYSAPSIWGQIFGTGAPSKIPGYYEWTYTGNTSSLSHLPDAWCLAGTSTCAQFFGGQTSASGKALMWQWSGGGGTSNGYGDFDQIDGQRTP